MFWLLNSQWRYHNVLQTYVLKFIDTFFLLSFDGFELLICHLITDLSSWNFLGILYFCDFLFYYKCTIYRKQFDINCVCYFIYTIHPFLFSSFLINMFPPSSGKGKEWYVTFLLEQKNIGDLITSTSHPMDLGFLMKTDQATHGLI